MGLVKVRAVAANRYALDVTSAVSVGHPDSQFLFGGAGLAAAIAALEAATARPTVWAAAQYLSYARPPAVLELEVTVPVAGKHTTQARATGRVGEAEIVTVNAALGARPVGVVAQWAAMPDAPPPAECPAMTYSWVRRDDDINAQVEQRVARGRQRVAAGESLASDDGRSAMWVRPRDPATPIDRVALAVIADFLPSAISNALGRDAGGNSLDNTIRFIRLAPTDWVFCDMRIHALHGGFAHGRMHLFAQDGTLLATASQSLIARVHGE